MELHIPPGEVAERDLLARRAEIEVSEEKARAGERGRAFGKGALETAVEVHGDVGSAVAEMLGEPAVEVVRRGDLEQLDQAGVGLGAQHPPGTLDDGLEARQVFDLARERARPPKATLAVGAADLLESAGGS